MREVRWARVAAACAVALLVIGVVIHLHSPVSRFDGHVRNWLFHADLGPLRTPIESLRRLCDPVPYACIAALLIWSARRRLGGRAAAWLAALLILAPLAGLLLKAILPVAPVPNVDGTPPES